MTEDSTEIPATRLHEWLRKNAPDRSEEGGGPSYVNLEGAAESLGLPLWRIGQAFDELVEDGLIRETAREFSYRPPSSEPDDWADQPFAVQVQGGVPR